MRFYLASRRVGTARRGRAAAPAGRLWAAWYAGVTPSEDHNNYEVLSTSGDGGATWKEVLE